MSEQLPARDSDWRTRLLGAVITPGALRSVVALFVITLALFGANLLFTAQEVNQLRGAVLASCHFNADLGTVPVSVNPKTGQASLLGVSIVSDARVAWHRLGCEGRLAAPAPSFVRWARFYKLPVN